VSSSVTGSSVTSAASADAVPGQYDVNVTSLARSQSLATGGFAEDATFSAGTLTFGFLDASGVEDLEVSVEDGDTLEAVRDSINAAGSSVTASIINNGNETDPYQLVLSTSDTGTNAAIQSITFDGGDEGLAYDPTPADPGSYNGMTETVAAVNAELTVNGIDVTSQSNQVEEAIQGVTLSLAEVGASTVVVEQDNLAVRNAVNEFVNTYNAYEEAASNLTRFNAETGAAGELLGDSALRSIDGRLSSALSLSTGAEGTFEALNEIGISLQADGTLELDQERLDEVITGDRQGLVDFFAGQTEDGGFAGSLGQTLSNMLGDSGLLENARTGVETKISSLEDRAERMDQASDRLIERYRVQFAQLDGMIAEMNQMSNYLTQQFDNMNAALGRE
jgi:flagellar hook-associated protein 2